MLDLYSIERTLCDEKNMNTYSVYIYMLVINKYIDFLKSVNLEPLDPKSARQFFYEKILKLDYYGTQALYCTALKLFFLVHNIEIDLPKIKNKYTGHRHPQIIPGEDLDKLFTYFSTLDMELEPFIFFRNKLLFHLIFQSAPALKEVRMLDIDSLDFDQVTVSYSNREIPLADETVETAEKYLYYRAPEFFSKPALFLNVSRKNRLTNKGIENIFYDFCHRAGINYYSPLSFAETCLYYFLAEYESAECREENKGFAFLMHMTGIRHPERIIKLQNYQIRQKTDPILPHLI